MIKLSKKKLVGLILGLVVVGSGVAYAYWTAAGSGTGTASTDDAVEAVTVVQTSTVTGLAPGLPAQTLSGKFTNPNDGPVYVGTVTASIASVTVGGQTAVGCDDTDYSLTNKVLTINAEVSPEDTTTWSGVKIAFNNKSSNQDACKGATVNLAYSVS